MTFVFHKKNFDTRWDQLKQDRNSYMPHWRELSEHIQPRQGRFLETKDTNRGGKKNNKIINAVATDALRTLASGMMAGLTSPARPWFNLASPNPRLSEFALVKQWLDDVERGMNTVFSKSNLYSELPKFYKSLALFGVGAMAVVEDFDKLIRFHTYSVGEFCIANNETLKVDVFYREYELSVSQTIERFGIDNVSVSVRNMYNQNQTEKTVKIRNAIEPNDDRIPDLIDNRNMKYRSVHYEVDQTEDKYLSISGFERFPVLVTRWETEGSDSYSGCPAMDALGDIKQLQLEEKRKAELLDKASRPPMRAPSTLRNKPASILPGGITYDDGNSNGAKFEPVFQVNHNIASITADIQTIERRISRMFYADLFLSLINSDRRQITAREVEEIHEEKLLMLGPVLERLNDEFLDPLIDIVFDRMLEAGLLPEAPQELHGVEIKVEYISILHQAQRSVGISAIDRMVGYISNLAQVDPNAIDKLNTDESIDKYADMLGVPASIIKSAEEVLKQRQERQQAEQQAQVAASLQQAVDASKSLSETNITGDNILGRLAGQVSQ